MIWDIANVCSLSSPYFPGAAKQRQRPRPNQGRASGMVGRLIQARIREWDHERGSGAIGGKKRAAGAMAGLLKPG
ncbi:hypothetical protein FAK_26730 [Desulfoferula mesophila]|uniref:Uncharacterized protein n=1 Tax=Desulfoferula mesophila TaxID=3058419 RepID=A0AAU9EGI7_9BACT|nr:hypothetical protein FAK_26730 [Desulfoferula mesophilus]